MLIRSAPGDAPRSPELHRRLRWLVVTVITALGALVGRLWQLQIVRGDEYYELARENVVAESYLPSVRGKILDRNGVALADNRPAFHVYVTPRLVDDAGRDRLIEILRLDPDEAGRLRTRLAAARQRTPARAVMVLEDVGRDRRGLVAQARLELGPGVEVRDEPYRDYPFGVTAAHLIGYMNQPSSKELVELEQQGYDPSEFIGRYGIEKEWELFLHGRRGIERFITNAKGERVDDPSKKDLIKGPTFEAPVAGHDVVLTIDLRLQRLAEKAVGGEAAAGVAVVEVDTGRILALVSSPSFDPNVMTGHLTRAEDERMKADLRRPYVDKTLQQHYPPGSTYKIVVAGAALEDGLASQHERLGCQRSYKVGRRVFHCLGEHGVIDMLEAIQRSCNIYFWKLSERVGMDRMAEVARDLGFGAPTGLGINTDVAGRVPTKAFYEKSGGLQIGHTLNAATGQGDDAVTVLQLAMAYAAIANGGRLYAPQLVQKVVAASGQLVAEYQPVQRRRIKLSAATLEVLRQGMWRVVNAPGGTAHAGGRSRLIEIAGKTGTAQVRSVRQAAQEKGTGEYQPTRAHAWFAGWAPAREPEIAIVVLVEHGGHGGVVAAPIARTIIEGYFTELKHMPMPLEPPPPELLEKARKRKGTRP
ncbi:MAG TPA: penicillin-binding protein 2 [Kofleriaceae bacterium]|nr:penicillin-binding protein 2 [Kofleriaceae bacterium]